MEMFAVGISLSNVKLSHQDCTKSFIRIHAGTHQGRIIKQLCQTDLPSVSTSGTSNGEVFRHLEEERASFYIEFASLERDAFELTYTAVSLVCPGEDSASGYPEAVQDQCHGRGACKRLDFRVPATMPERLMECVCHSPFSNSFVGGSCDTCAFGFKKNTFPSCDPATICGNNCSGRGRCIAGVGCQCESGYFALDCQLTDDEERLGLPEVMSVRLPLNGGDAGNVARSGQIDRTMANCALPGANVHCTVEQRETGRVYQQEDQSLFGGYSLSAYIRRRQTLVNGTAANATNTSKIDEGLTFNTLVTRNTYVDMIRTDNVTNTDLDFFGETTILAWIKMSATASGFLLAKVDSAFTSDGRSPALTAALVDVQDRFIPLSEMKLVNLSLSVHTAIFLNGAEKRVDILISDESQKGMTQNKETWMFARHFRLGNRAGDLYDNTWRYFCLRFSKKNSIPLGRIYLDGGTQIENPNWEQCLPFLPTKTQANVPDIANDTSLVSVSPGQSLLWAYRLQGALDELHIFRKSLSQRKIVDIGGAAFGAVMSINMGTLLVLVVVCFFVAFVWMPCAVWRHVRSERQRQNEAENADHTVDDDAGKPSSVDAVMPMDKETIDELNTALEMQSQASAMSAGGKGETSGKQAQPSVDATTATSPDIRKDVSSAGSKVEKEKKVDGALLAEGGDGAQRTEAEERHSSVLAKIDSLKTVIKELPSKWYRKVKGRPKAEKSEGSGVVAAATEGDTIGTATEGEGSKGKDEEKDNCVAPAALVEIHGVDDILSEITLRFDELQGAIIKQGANNNDMEQRNVAKLKKLTVLVGYNAKKEATNAATNAAMQGATTVMDAWQVTSQSATSLSYPSLWNGYFGSFFLVVGFQFLPAFGLPFEYIYIPLVILSVGASFGLFMVQLNTKARSKLQVEERVEEIIALREACIAEKEEYKDEMPKKEKLVFVCLKLLTILYMPTTQQSIQIVSCDGIIACQFDCYNESTHKVLVIVAGFYLAIVSVGIPIFFTFIVRRVTTEYLAFLGSYDTSEEHMALQSKFWLPFVDAVRTPFNDLYEKYTYNNVYFDSITLLYKASASMFLIALPSESESQLLCFVLLQALYCIICAHVQPFRYPRVNAILVAAHGYILVTMGLQNMFILQPDNDSIGVVMVLITIAVLLFEVVVLIIIFRAAKALNALQDERDRKKEKEVTSPELEGETGGNGDSNDVDLPAKKDGSHEQDNIKNEEGEMNEDAVSSTASINPLVPSPLGVSAISVDMRKQIVTDDEHGGSVQAVNIMSDGDDHSDILAARCGAERAYLSAESGDVGRNEREF